MIDDETANNDSVDLGETSETYVDQEANPELKNLLRTLVREGGSDLHLQVGNTPLVRVDGRLRPASETRLSEADAYRMIYSIMNDEQREQFHEDRDLDLSYELEGVARFRVNIFYQRGKTGAAFRLIPFQVRTIDDWGLPPILKKLALQPRGFVLITGPTGSGKSTTLAAMIEEMNRYVRRHVITIEDPIEFSFADKKCIVEQREVGVDTHSFAESLRHIMRQNPDVIMVGEMRDLETISLALSAAEMGSLVLATLHTRTAYHTVDRVIDVFPSEQQSQVRYQLAGSLSAVVSQSLIPNKTGGGRSAAFEVMICNDAIRNAIREGKPQQIPSLIQGGAGMGMKLLDKSLEELVVSDQVTYEDALSRSADPKRFESVLSFYGKSAR